MNERELPPGEDFRDEEFADGDEDGGTKPCPNCRREMYDGADRCPHCGEYVVAHSAPAKPFPAWMIVGVVLAMGVLILLALR